EKVAADGDIDAPPAGAVERAALFRTAAALHERREINGHTRAIQRAVQATGDGEDRVANGFPFEALEILPMEEQVLWIGRFDLRGLTPSARHPVGTAQHDP